VPAPPAALAVASNLYSWPLLEAVGLFAPAADIFDRGL